MKNTEHTKSRFRLSHTKKWMLLAILVLAPFAAGALHAQDISGTWQGTLQPPGAPNGLRTVMKIAKAPDGSLKTVMYSIDQGGAPINVLTTTLQGSDLKIAVPAIGGTYQGKLSADGNSINGTWTQGPGAMPLNLARATPATEWTIPPPPVRLPPMDPKFDPAFEVATIKPTPQEEAGGRGFRVMGRRFSTLNTTLVDLIAFSYGVQDKQVIGAPPWATSDHYDLEAEPDGEGQPNDAQWKTMVKKLLADRFKLTLRPDKRELSVYTITVAPGGSKLTPSQGDPNGLPGVGVSRFGMINARNATIHDFAGTLQNTALDRPVVDQTGLTGRFDFTLQWTPDQFQFAGLPPPPPGAGPPQSDNPPPDLFTAMQQELGLKLDATKAPADVLVVDHVEPPSPN